VATDLSKTWGSVLFIVKSVSSCPFLLALDSSIHPLHSHCVRQSVLHTFVLDIPLYVAMLYVVCMCIHTLLAACPSVCCACMFVQRNAIIREDRIIQPRPCAPLLVACFADWLQGGGPFIAFNASVLVSVSIQTHRLAYLPMCVYVSECVYELVRLVHELSDIYG